MSTDRQTLNGVSPLERLLNIARDLYLEVPLEHQETVRAEVNYWIVILKDAIADGHQERERLAKEHLKQTIDKWT